MVADDAEFETARRNAGRRIAAGTPESGTGTTDVDLDHGFRRELRAKALRTS